MERLTARIKNNPAVPAKFDLDFVLGSNIDDTTWKCLDALIQRLAAYEDTGLEPDKIQRWVSVKERLPKPEERVLVYVPKRDGCFQNGYFLGKLHKIEADNAGSGNFWGIKTPGSEWTLWGWSYFEKPIPSHWMPLPQPPKEEK